MVLVETMLPKTKYCLGMVNISTMVSATMAKPKTCEKSLLFSGLDDFTLFHHLLDCNGQLVIQQFEEFLELFSSDPGPAGVGMTTTGCTQFCCDSSQYPTEIVP